jgi:D-alanyl-D-alanine carboxypeptidase
LSKTDPQLLEKYSKVFFLNEYYAPAELIAIPNDYSYSDTKVLKFQSEVWPHLKLMIDDAKSAGVTMYVFSAYRSFNEQSALKNDYKVTYGAGTANSFSADQGYSEHQLGTAVDMIAPGLGGVLDGFDGTKAYTWLLANAYRYGFTISYPKGNTSYVFEPWHWRFVGVKLATDLHNQGKNFYDLDQRTIDTYLVNFFD